MFYLEKKLFLFSFFNFISYFVLFLLFCCPFYFYFVCMWFSSFPLLQTRGLNSSANSKFCDKRASHTETTTTLFTTFCSRRLEQPALLESLAVVRGPRAAPEPLPQSSAPAGLTHRPCYWSRRPRRRRRPLAPGRTGWCWCRWHSSAR